MDGAVLRLATAPVVAGVGVVGALVDPFGADVTLVALFAVMFVSAHIPTRGPRPVRRRSRVDDAAEPDPTEA